MQVESFEWQPSDEELAFVPLCVAAAQAYEAIAGRLPADRAARERRCNAVAAQLAAIAPIYAEQGGIPRQLTRVELMLARFEGGGARLVHRDRAEAHTGLRIRRLHLAEAIERLKQAHRAG